jgi:mono/diheme cytochrome c family protein
MNRRILTTIAAMLLWGCSPRTPGPGAATPAQTEDTGERIYSGNCLPCHQQDGRGIPNVYPSLAGSPVVVGDPQELALWVIRSRRPATLPAGRYPSAMPPFGWLKAQDAAALLTYVRSNFGNAAPPVDAATVARALGE